MSAAAHKHRAAFTLALRTISPTLSALHASRLRLLPGEDQQRSLGAALSPQAPPLTTLTCVRCGHASVRVRVVRSKTRKEKQALYKRVDMNEEQGKGKNTAMDKYSATKETTPSRVLERTCTTCDFVERTPMARGAAALFQSTSTSSARKAREAAKSRANAMVTTKLSAADAKHFGNDASDGAHSSAASSGFGAPPGLATPHVNTAPAHPVAMPSPPVSDPAPRKRSKKKPGLQELLARNRQRQDAAARANAPGGLSSFLGGL